MLRWISGVLLMGWGTSLLLVAVALVLGQQVPNEGELAFVWMRSDSRDIYALDISRSVRVPLIRSAADEWSPAWSPDGRWLAFISGRDSPQGELYIMNVATHETRQITHNRRNEFGPQWSPDSQEVVFTQNDNGYFHLHTLRIDSGATRQLSGQAADFQPAWSRDGSYLAYVSFSGISVTAYVVDSRSSRTLSISPKEGAYYTPSWSPDDRQIAFAWRRSQSSIAVVNWRDGSVRTLTDGVDNTYAPSWSPDGHWIAFASGGVWNDSLYRTDADGQNLRLLATAEKIKDSPVWSPDSKRLLFVSFEHLWSEQGDVYLVTMDSDQPRRLPIQAVSDSDFAWRP